MIQPDNIAEIQVTLKDVYFDLRGLSAYSTFGVSTLRAHIKKDKLPAFRVNGKVLIRKAEFDHWIESYRINTQRDIQSIADDALNALKKAKSNR